MFKNYFKTALRNLARHKGFSLINVLGLAIGIACSLLVALYVRTELGYDAFHRNADRIYRLAFTEDRAYKTVNFPISSGGLAPAMIKELPEVMNAVRFTRVFAKDVRLKDRQFLETRMFYADPGVFELFSFPLVKGDPRTALTEPQTAVVTEALAEKYFGEKDPVGETLVLEGNLDFRITGVVKNVPANSHFHFNLLASLTTLRAVSDEWRSSSCYTYILVRDGVPPARLEARIAELFDRHKRPTDKRVFYLQPLRAIHLR
ncbi:MAG: ABC transporter permease, partial [Candidatus Aminicenantes bacterium]|nr:ABC transporter permease [Candidatus Aminicenantes bacterium]